MAVQLITSKALNLFCLNPHGFFGCKVTLPQGVSLHHLHDKAAAIYDFGLFCTYFLNRSTIFYSIMGGG